MLKVFVIGGMGAGKSTVSHAMADEGYPLVDLDKVGHQVLTWDVVKDDLRETFGDDIFDEAGEVVRARLAARAFVDSASTDALNKITQPRIESALLERLDSLEREGAGACIVECSVLKNRTYSLAMTADYVVAVTTPLETRVSRCIAKGFAEEDVRARIAQQVSDSERIQMADFVIENVGSLDEVKSKAVACLRDIVNPQA